MLRAVTRGTEIRVQNHGGPASATRTKRCSRRRARRTRSDRRSARSEDRPQRRRPAGRGTHLQMPADLPASPALGVLRLTSRTLFHSSSGFLAKPRAEKLSAARALDHFGRTRPCCCLAYACITPFCAQGHGVLPSQGEGRGARCPGSSLPQAAPSGLPRARCEGGEGGLGACAGPPWCLRPPRCDPSGLLALARQPRHARVPRPA